GGGGQRADDGQQVRQRAAAAAGGGPRRRFGVEAGTGCADDPALRAARPFRAHQVHGDLAAFHEASRGPARIGGEAEVAGGVTAAAGEDGADHGTRTLVADGAVDDLVQRAVAADRDDETDAGLGGVAREIRRASWAA